MLHLRLLALAAIAVAAPAPSHRPILCPEACDCIELPSGHIEAACASTAFLQRLQPKQVSALVSLQLANQNLPRIPSKLKKLKGLRRLDLSGNGISDLTELSNLPKLTRLSINSNHIKHLAVQDLPTSLQYLDISNNYITAIPRHLNKLPTLLELNLAGNPISCSCESLESRVYVLSLLLKPVYCHSPEKLQGQLLQDAMCLEGQDHFELPLADEPVIEGSGAEPDEPITDSNIYDDEKDQKYANFEEEELIPETTKKPTESSTEDEALVEGSGDIFNEDLLDKTEENLEGSGEEEVTEMPIIPIRHTPDQRLKSCNFNCTPIDTKLDSNDTSADPDVVKEILNLFGHKTTTTEVPIAEKEAEVIHHDDDNEKELHAEVTKENTAEATPADVVDENEKIQEAMNVEDTEKSSFNTNVIIVAILIVIMIALVAYSIKKRRGGRLELQEYTEQEMKPLASKPTNGGSGIPEKVPLMNGQNGNMNGKQNEEPVVTLRKKDEDDEDSKAKPETQKVTIQAKELSTPKTPLLVTRSRRDDGQYVATPNVSS